MILEKRRHVGITDRNITKTKKGRLIFWKAIICKDDGLKQKNTAINTYNGVKY